MESGREKVNNSTRITLTILHIYSREDSEVIVYPCLAVVCLAICYDLMAITTGEKLIASDCGRKK